MEEYKPLIEATIKRFYDDIDSEIIGLLDHPKPEDKLIDLYWDISNAAKERVGTSSGYTGFSELLFFRYILLYLERAMDCRFQAHQETESTRSFRAKDIILTHDIGISRFLDNVKDQRTDITIMRTGPGGNELLAAFQIKIYISSPSALRDDIEKLRDLLENTEAKVYEIIFLGPSRKGAEELREFCREFDGRAFVIGKEDIGCNVSVREAVERVEKGAGRRGQIEG